MVIEAIGGLGLFLLGMIVMTDGLRNLAGKRMRAALMHFTHTPLSGAVSGALTTAVLQSSSATTVATVGFVNAGLIRFPDALGIIFGANLGTTITGWLVAIIGFKLRLGSIALPLIFTGAILKLFSKGRYSNLGYAIAGFGLIFVGITTMQEGMGGLGNIISPDRLPADTFFGRSQLVLLGIIATLITQSSSAGVAATLTALYAGAVTFEQAAALIIGMDVGTTVTAMMATIGASVNARRTGIAHVLFNLFTAAIALLFITPYTWLWGRLAPGQLLVNAEIALVLFHSSFNLLGVGVMLPASARFARLIQRLVPSQQSSYTGRLDEGLLAQPEIALSAVQQSAQAELIALLEHVRAILGDPEGRVSNLSELEAALDETQEYLDKIQWKSNDSHHVERLSNLIHTLDHLQRLFERCEEEEDRANIVKTTDELTKDRNVLIDNIPTIIRHIHKQKWLEASKNASEVSAKIDDQVHPFRSTTVCQVAYDEIDLPQGTSRLEAIRWLRRVTTHIMYITRYLHQTSLAAGENSEN